MIEQSVGDNTIFQSIILSWSAGTQLNRKQNFRQGERTFSGHLPLYLPLYPLYPVSIVSQINYVFRYLVLEGVLLLNRTYLPILYSVLVAAEVY